MEKEVFYQVLCPLLFLTLANFLQQQLTYEWLVDQYKKKCVKQGSRADGCSTNELVRQFKHRLKIGIQLAIAAGLGAMIQAAGQPWAGIGSA